MKLFLPLILIFAVSCHPKMNFENSGMRTVTATSTPLAPNIKKLDVVKVPEKISSDLVASTHISQPIALSEPEPEPIETAKPTPEPAPVVTNVKVESRRMPAAAPVDIKQPETKPVKAIPEKSVAITPLQTQTPVVKQVSSAETHPANFNTEYFEQKEKKVDILFIVDNSPSMRKEQLRMAERLQSFMKDIQYTDWQIAFTTSDVSNRKHAMRGGLLDLVGHPNQKVLTKNFADANDVFLNTIYRPEGRACLFRCPSSKEQPLKASILAMEKHDTENDGFFREDADLSIVILTDEDEMSYGGRKATKPYQVVDTFHSIFGPDKKLSVYGIIVQPNDTSCIASQNERSIASPGTHVSELSELTGGYTGSICDTDYTASLEKISESTRLASDFYQLKEAPLANTVEVKLLPEQDIKWNLKDNQVTFTKPPKTGTQVQITYQY